MPRLVNNAYQVPDRILRWVGQSIHNLGSEASQAMGQDVIGGAKSAGHTASGAMAKTVHSTQSAREADSKFMQTQASQKSDAAFHAANPSVPKSMSQAQYEQGQYQNQQLANAINSAIAGSGGGSGPGSQTGMLASTNSNAKGA